MFLASVWLTVDELLKSALVRSWGDLSAQFNPGTRYINHDNYPTSP